MDKDDTISIFNHDVIVTVKQFAAEGKPYPSIGFAVSCSVLI